MATSASEISIGAFASECGDRQRTAEEIAGFPELCAAAGLANFRSLGCSTYWQMTRPVETYVAASIAKTLAAGGIAAADVDYLLLATADPNLAVLDEHIVRTVFAAVGLTKCIPLMVSLQQCVSSLAALHHAHQLLADPRVRHVIVAAFDFMVKDVDRIKPFALYSDAVASCLVSRTTRGIVSLESYGVHLDSEGLMGRDSFESRKRVAARAIGDALAERISLAQVAKCFATNLYKPLAVFNASICGYRTSQLYVDTLATHAHCGNCDWMINLMHCHDRRGISAGQYYLAQSSAPGFFGCGLLRAMGDA